MHRGIFIVGALLAPGSAWAAEAPAYAEEIPACDAEPTGEAAQAVTQTQRDICLGAVTLGAGLGCLAAQQACTASTVITVGGTAFPCVIVLAVACAALPASAAVYYNRYCQNLR